MKQYKKIITTCLLTLGLAVTQLNTFTSYGYSKVDGTYQLLDGTKIDGVIARGIDISHWQGVIDWSKVSTDDVTFAMLGTRYSGKIDPNFHTNATNASKEGVKLGAYIYSYATTPEMALQEADFILDLVKDYPISYPIAFDMEDSAQSSLTPAEVSTLINTFCQRIEEAGYYPILYANDYWLANKIDMSQIKYDVWVARYEIKHAYPNPVMWQATSTGSINGIKGNVDIDFQYKDFSSSIPQNQWRTIANKTYYYQNYVMQKNTWIQDNNGWYYMDQDGLTSKGWLNLANKTYYLDNSTGKMTTGWNNVDQIWYYFNPSGNMATGWINDNGTRYFTDNTGKMQTGWLNYDDKFYYLKGSGDMATGWRSIDNYWHFFNSTGEMATGWVNDNGIWYFINNNGQMQTGWLQQGNQHYYLRGSGAMATGWRSLENQWYYFKSSGDMATGWINDNGTWYFINNNGQMQTGWFSDQNNRYYLDPTSGAMAANTTLTVDGVNYSVNESGICQEIIGETEAPGQETNDPIVVPSSPQTPELQNPPEIGPGIS